MKSLVIGLSILGTFSLHASETKIYKVRINETIQQGSSFISLNTKDLESLQEKARNNAREKCEKSEGRKCDEVGTKLTRLNFVTYSSWYPKLDVSIESSFSVSN